MPWGSECRAKLIKQLPAKPTQRRGERDITAPGPLSYDPPELLGGNGFSHIKRAPAYTFGRNTPVEVGRSKAATTAKMFNCRGWTAKGPQHISGGILTPEIPPLGDKMKVPGPGTYEPRTAKNKKSAPAYSCRTAAKPYKEPWDMWKPSPNMYHPPIPCKRVPAYTLGYGVRELRAQTIPGPGQHDPNYKYGKKRTPQFSMAPTFRNLPPMMSPAPNTYCEKKLMVNKRTIPAITFGILHSPYLGNFDPHIRQTAIDKQYKTSVV